MLRFVPRTAAVCLVFTPCLAAAAVGQAEGVAEARRALAAGDLDGVVFALAGAGDLAGAEALEAGRLLLRAGRRALEGGDSVLALQACQMGRRLLPGDAELLLVCVAAARRLQQFGAAERYTKELLHAHPGDWRGHLWAARLAQAQGEWARAEAAALRVDPGAAPKDAVAEAQRIAEAARAEQAARAAALSELASLAAKLRREIQAGARVPLGTAGDGAQVGPAPAEEVVLYGTAWCGYCKKARRWLKRRGIPFVDRDVERDPEAVQELARKARAAGVLPRGVPVIDVAGELVLGWSPEALEAAV
ncbi:MAG: hypothetical protein D6729_01635, partial [Deltaproteobacteria bacterium]